ncbi:DUF1501 domain-containing protein [Tundrisphaera lichenicola]|uniref:DUF1501 domain-containing protein n=1 Tax=Tundrisphaera lichenicola TaxID=2029860 RepID=UPI003EBDC2B0
MVPHKIWTNSRRDFLARAGMGFGALALSSLMGDEARAEMPEIDPLHPLAPRPTHFAPKVKSCIFLFMEGGPSHIDLFDPKPELAKHAGKPLPPSFGKVFTAMGVGGNSLLPTKRTFKQHGESGTWVSDWYPHIAEVVDDIALIRSCWADGVNHVGSVCQMNTGSILAGRPSLGAWVTYGLGTENQDLPAFVVMQDAGEPLGGPRNWGNSWLPATFQGTPFRKDGTPILHLAPPGSITEAQQKAKLGLIADLDRIHAAPRSDDSRLAARIAAYELAYRMQAHAPEAVDLSNESEETKTLYGLDDDRCKDYGAMCLRARRLVERGVRFVQLYCGSGSQWDAHSNIEGNHSKLCARSDRPIAALLKDLKRRGLLDSTLVVWGGEFGRTPMSEGTDGRDHNPYGFSMFLAGGGVKPGVTVGTTDEFGLHAVEDKVHVHDLHATILHLMGVDHRQLTYFRDGRDERLTVNGGVVVDKVLS